MIAFRILAVLSTAVLIAAFALANLLPPDLPLGQALLAADPSSMVALHDAASVLGGAPIWDAVVAPMLTRPVWILPLMLGIVLAGLAFTLRPTKTQPSRHRRS